jgi:hypothetical protein
MLGVFVLAATGLFAAVAGHAGAAVSPPSGCTAVAKLSVTGCSYQSKTPFAEAVLVGANSAVFVNDFPCAQVSDGAETTLCFTGGSKAHPVKVVAFAFVPGAVTVRDT